MRCPFLKRTRVRYCALSPIRKMLADTGDPGLLERCSTALHLDCPLLTESASASPGEPARGQCAYLCTMTAQYCDAAPVRKLIPYQDCQLSRCQTDAHEYCPLFRQRAHPRRSHSHGSGCGGSEEIEMSAGVAYFPNHMWMHEGEFELCHVGVDAFVPYVVGRIDRVQLVSPRGLAHPTAVITAGARDLTFVLPETIDLTGSNVHLLSHPEAIQEDPYGEGWMYEGLRSRAIRDSVPAGVSRSGPAAREWMDRELSRLDTFVRDSILEDHREFTGLATDGGRTIPGLARHLGRDEALELARRFFTLPREEEV